MSILKHIKAVVFIGIFLVGVGLYSGDEGVFRWSGDVTSGKPSLYFDPRNESGGGSVEGFEKDIAEAIAREMGVVAKFLPNDWDGLIAGLGGMYDAIINSYAICDTEGKSYVFSEPYYKTYLQLVTRKDNNKIKALGDCRGRTLGTLRSSRAGEFAQEYARRMGGDVAVSFYQSELNFFTDLAHGRVDAVLIDAPAALFQVSRNKNLKLVGGAVAEVDYGVVVKKGNVVLLNEVNKAIRRLKGSGELRRILEKWGLWNDRMAKYTGDYEKREVEGSYLSELAKASEHEETFRELIGRYVSYMPLLWRGAVMTIEISIIGMLVAMVFGAFLALFRVYGPLPTRWAVKCFIEVIRGTPLLIQLYFIFYGLPAIGVKFSPFVAGVLTLGVNYAAYEAENYRAGILSVPKGQMEAAKALGMTQWQGLMYVVMPQALRVVLPPITNDFISLIKDSSLVSVVTIIDLTFVYNLLATSSHSYFGIGIVVALFYLVLGLPFVLLTRLAERRFAAWELKGKKGGK